MWGIEIFIGAIITTVLLGSGVVLITRKRRKQSSNDTSQDGDRSRSDKHHQGIERGDAATGRVRFEHEEYRTPREPISESAQTRNADVPVPHDPRIEERVGQASREGLVTDAPGLPDAPIGYSPLSGYVRNLPKGFYPVVELPVHRCTVIGTRVGRPGPRGVSEHGFYTRLEEYFNGQLLRDHRVEFRGAQRDYEPDIILHLPDRVLRIDIEIDEPYSGVSRKPMHWLGSYDDDRDVYFSNNGWLTVRFAEEQVIKQSASCAAFLAEVIDSLLGTQTRAAIGSQETLAPIARWSYSEAKQMAELKYREGYLGIEFEAATEDVPESIETEEGIVLDDEGTDDGNVVEVTSRNTGLTTLTDEQERLLGQLREAVPRSLHLLFIADGQMKLMQPLRIQQRRSRLFVHGFDQLCQQEEEVELRHIEQILAELEDPFYSTGSIADLEKLKEDMNIAIDNQLLVQITYRKDCGEISERTLSTISESSPFGKGYLTAYCHLRSEGRTFKLDRIQSYRVLGIQRPWEDRAGPNGEVTRTRLVW